MAKTFKSEITDTIILLLEDRMKRAGRHLLKTDTILRMCSAEIDLTDEMPERAELLEIGLYDIPFIIFQVEYRMALDIHVSLGGPHLLWVVQIQEGIGNEDKIGIKVR